MCDNKISYFIPRGFDVKEVFVKCGTTDPHGGRAQCDDCQNNAAARAEHERIMENSKADNEWLKSAGWGEM